MAEHTSRSAVQRRRPAARRKRRPEVRPGGARLQGVVVESLALLGLALALVALLGYVAATPPTAFVVNFGQADSPVLVRAVADLPRAEPIALAVDRPPQVILTDFHDLQNNPEGAYRWTKPAASLTIPIAAPADYRVALTLQDNVNLTPPRPVAVSINDGAPQTIQLTGDRREYTFDYRAAPSLWAGGVQPALTVSLRTSPVTAPGDRRELGVVMSGVAIGPASMPSPWQPALLLPGLAVLAVAYGVVRGVDGGVATASGTCGALLGAFALLALGARPAALLLAYQPSAHPVWFAALLLAHVAVVPGSWLILRRPAAAHQAAANGDGHAAPPAPAANDRPAGERRDWAAALRGVWRAALSSGLREAFWIFVIGRVAFSAFALVVALVATPAAPCTWRGQEPMSAGGAAELLLGVWQRADTCWYEKIATLGYRPGDPSVVFFPLFPLLMHLGSLPFAGILHPLASDALGGMIVSGVAYIAALMGLYQLVARDFGILVARRALLYLAAFPTAFFFFGPYTEALFLAFAAWSLALARRGSWAGAGLLALLASLTRTQGCLLALPLAWEVYRQWRTTAGPARPRGAWVLAPLLPVHGLLAYLAYGRTFVGWTTFQAQPAEWGYTLLAPWTLLAHSWGYIAREWGTGERLAYVEAITLGLLLLVGALLVVGARRLPLTYTLYAAPHLAIFLTRESFVIPLLSVSRYVLILFPAFVALALLDRRRRVHYPWLIASTLLLGILLFMYVTQIFVA